MGKEDAAQAAVLRSVMEKLDGSTGTVFSDAEYTALALLLHRELSFLNEPTRVIQRKGDEDERCNQVLNHMQSGVLPLMASHRYNTGVTAIIVRACYHEETKSFAAPGFVATVMGGFDDAADEACQDLQRRSIAMCLSLGGQALAEACGCDTAMMNRYADRAMEYAEAQRKSGASESRVGRLDDAEEPPKPGEASDG